MPWELDKKQVVSPPAWPLNSMSQDRDNPYQDAKNYLDPNGLLNRVNITFSDGWQLHQRTQFSNIYMKSLTNGRIWQYSPIKMQHWIEWSLSKASVSKYSTKTQMNGTEYKQKD